MSQPLVSVIIPVYNHEKYVEKALDSVFNQTYPLIEVIIIDDGSKDNSVVQIENFLEKWKKSSKIDREVMFIKQTNQGAHHTINQGLNLAQGEFLTILNSDDFFHTSRIEIFVNELKRQNADWIFSGVCGINSKNEALSFDHPWKTWYENTIKLLAITPTIGFTLLRQNVTVSTGNLFFSKKMFSKIGPFINIKLAHDLDFALRALIISEPIFVSEQLYYYRYHDSNTLHSVVHLLESELETIRRDYLLKVVSKPPLNTQAPSFWYWPTTFTHLCAELKMDKLLYPLDIPNQEKKHIKGNKNKLSEGILENFDTKNNKKRAITLITHDLSLTGSPKVVLDLALILKKKCFQVNIISQAEGPMRRSFEENQIPVYAIPNRFSSLRINKKLKSYLNLVFAFPKIYFKTQKTVIANCSVALTTLLPLLTLSRKKKFFWYIHDSFSPSSCIPTGLPMKIFNKVKNACNLKVWFGSSSTQQIWEQDGIKGTVKYWSGIPKQPHRKIARHTLSKLLFVGTICPRKGTRYLVDAFIKCVKEKLIEDHVTLTVIGFDEAYAKDGYIIDLLMKIVQANLNDRITILPSVQPAELQTYYEEADLFIQSSIVECLPLSLLHAMSIGIPIITTNVNGCVEAIQDKKTGYVCKSRSSEELCKTISEALNNPQKTLEYGIKAQEEFNQRFTLEITAEKILEDLKHT